MEPTESAAPDSRLRLRRPSAHGVEPWAGRLCGASPTGPAHRAGAGRRPPVRRAHRRARSGTAGPDPIGTVLARTARDRGCRCVLGAGFSGRSPAARPLPAGTVGWSLALLTGIIVGHLVALGRDRWWGGTGSGAALTLAVLLLYGWVPAGTGQPHRRRPGRHRPPAPLAAGRPARRGRHPRHRRRRARPRRLRRGAHRRDALGPRHAGTSTPPPRWSSPPSPTSRSPAPCSGTPAPRRGGGLPTVARTALLRQGLVARRAARHRPADLSSSPSPSPLLLPLFAIPLIALDSTLWIARARAEEQLRDPLTGLPNRQWLLERTWTALDDAERIGARVGARADRPRPLPVGQRHPRPSRGRPAAAADSRPAAARPAARGGGRAARRRRVRRTAARRRLHDIRARASPATSSPTLGSPLDLDGLTLVLEASAGRRRLPRPRARRRGAAAARGRGDVPGEAGPYGRRGVRVQAGLQHPRPARPAGRSAPRAGRAARSSCTTSPRSASTARSPGWRRWCAGCIRSAGRCRRTSSSRSPSRPG